METESLKYHEYPGFAKNEPGSEAEYHLEYLSLLGYSVMEDVISTQEADSISQLLERLYQKQELEFGKERLQKLNESDVLRALVIDDPIFLQLAANPKVLSLVHLLVGKSSILNLQNAICAKPGSKHHQSAYHRDFAKDFTTSHCIAMNAFWCINDFTKENGATWVVPYSHKFEKFPSERFIKQNGKQIEAKKGSVILWDSLLIHRAGHNTTSEPRHGINHMYTRPFIKQQIDLPEYLKGKIDIESSLGQLLGFWTIPPKSVKELRVDPDKRTYRRGQG